MADEDLCRFWGNGCHPSFNLEDLLGYSDSEERRRISRVCRRILEERGGKAADDLAAVAYLRSLEKKF